VTGPSNPRREHAGTRHTADTITSDALDALYNERDTALQHAATIAAQRDRLRTRMNALANRWEHALAPDKAYARTLRDEISCAPFDPEGAMVVKEYTERGRHLWAFRCWGTDTCDGWLGLGHHTQTSALLERERHVAEAHAGEQPAHVYLSTGCLHGDHDYCKNPTGLAGAKRPGSCKHCGAKCQCPCHAAITPKVQSSDPGGPDA
jgi:hypothetical protein